MDNQKPIQGAETLSTDAVTGVHIYRKEDILFVMIGTVIIPLDNKTFISVAEQMSNVVKILKPNE